MSTANNCQGLLLHSDFVALALPEAQVQALLADGALERIGEIEQDGSKQPVYAVAAQDVRAEIAAVLAILDRADVALEPAAARTRLLHALLEQRGIEDPDAATPETTNEDWRDHVPVNDPVGRTMDNVSAAMADLLASDEGAPTQADADPGEVPEAVRDDRIADEAAARMPEAAAASAQGPASPRAQFDLSGLEDLESAGSSGARPSPRRTSPDESTAVPIAAAQSVAADALDVLFGQPRLPATPARVDDVATGPPPTRDGRTPTLAATISLAPPVDNDGVVAVTPTDPAAANPVSDAGHSVLIEPLEQIQVALLTLAERPQPTVDLAPLIAAVDTGFAAVGKVLGSAGDVARVVAQLEQLTAATIASKAALVEVLLAQTRATDRQVAADLAPTAVVAAPTSTPGGRSPIGALAPVLFMVLGWVGALWLHTGDPRMAMLAFIGANAIACLAMLFRRAA